MPSLIQFGDLTPRHFAEHPIWASCHSFDYDEPWYDDTDEETFRPFSGPPPVAGNDGMYLVRAEFALVDGTALSGFVTPAGSDEAAPGALGTMQPQLFLPSGDRVGFWLGMFGQPRDAARALYSALGKSADSVFPITFAALPGLTNGLAAGELHGFYTIPDGQTVTVGR